MKKHFTAPWSNKVKIISIAASLMLALGAFWAEGLIGIALIVLIVVLLAFSIRGYSIMNGQLLVHRLGWSNKFNLEEITSISYEPHIMMGSLRLFGNGGFMGFTGWFQNSILGSYRAFVTDGKNTVVVHLNNKKIVVSPAQPAEFVTVVQEALADLEARPWAQDEDPTA